MHDLPPWLAAFCVAIVAWLFAPPQVFGGLRWLAGALRRRRGDRRLGDRRARFASTVAAQVTAIGEAGRWYDERYTELEAEVEVHGRGRRGLLWGRVRETIRRVPSLSAALTASADPIVLLEGEPGSGKSVALRHVALKLARHAAAHPSEDAVIPLYVNLKDFRPASPVDAAEVRGFVLASLNRANSTAVARFLDDEFDRGVEDGTWLFLFDSFDEIPAVLGAVEADDVIATYTDALYDFLTSMNACRGVIASREFRGPRRITWPRFRILLLTARQRKDLIGKLSLDRDTGQWIQGELAAADQGVRQLASNPLFLVLLCEYLRTVREFPRSVHVVFESYVARRFRDDQRRLLDRFGISAEAARAVAEQAAFCMSANAGLGLNPQRDTLLASMRQAGFDVTGKTEAALDALLYLRLASTAADSDGDGDFAFAHRRFQEYFATCLVLREPERAAPAGLLADGRWRETVVALLQTQDPDQVAPLLAQVELLLREMASSLSADGDGSFAWPPGSLHLLGLLQDGMRGEPDAPVRALAGRLLDAAFTRGQLHDRRWATELCLAADGDTARRILREAFTSESGWLREAAFAQASRLDPMPADMRRHIRHAITLLSVAAGSGSSGSRLTPSSVGCPARSLNCS